MPGEKWVFLFFPLNRLTVYYSCRYTLQLTSSTLEHVFTTYNCIHLARFPLICILGCIHTVHMAHFPFHLYVATLLVFYSVAPIISVYSMWAFYALLLWHANLPRGSIHPPKASVHCLFVHLPNQCLRCPLTPSSPDSASNSFSFITQLCFFSGHLIAFEISQRITPSYQRNLTDNGTRDRRSRTRKFLVEK